MTDAAKMSAGLDGLKATFDAFWALRNPRERRLLSVGAVALAIGLVYLLLFAPALAGRERYAKALPKLRQDAAEMESLARQLGDASANAAPEAAPVTHEAVEASLKQHGIVTQSLSVADGVIRVQANPVSFSALQAWLFEQQRANRISVTEANVSALSEVDKVNASLTLRQQRPGD